jgi:hypothetical protein
MSTYTGSTLASLNSSTPVGASDPVADVDNAIQQIKRVMVNNGAGGLLDYIYPVGCIWLSTTDNDPATTLGFGTWSELDETILTGRTVYTWERTA